MIRIIIFIIAIHFNIGLIWAQSGIDYNPKRLIAELSDLNGTERPVVKEIALPESLSRRIFQGNFFTVDNGTRDYGAKYVYVGRVNTCRSGGCSADPGLSSDHNSEYFDYFILFDAGCTVRLVKVYNYQATHGQEITAKGWLKQFIGYHGENKLNTGKNIDAISGATISTEAITTDIQDKTNLLKQIVNSVDISILR